jgi:tetratricopeptide (TPR) repeat protein
MTKAALILFGFAALMLASGTVRAQDTAAISAADTEAVMRQAKTIDLRQKLSDAKAVAQRGDVASAATLYQEACTLALQIGSGIPDETLQAVTGLTATRLELARNAQSRGDYLEADTEVKQILAMETQLKVAPNANEVIAFKQHNDELIVINKGRTPDAETMARVPQMVADRVAASTLVQDGKVLYEMQKYDAAESKLNEAITMEPGNTTASYYLNLIKQEKIYLDMVHHNTDTQDRMEHVERNWILPKPTANMPVPNPYATNNLVFTGPGRQAIVSKLDRIHLDNVSFDGLPLNEVLKQLSEQCRLRDPDRKGINFLINNNPDLSGLAVAAPTAVGVGGGGGFGAPAAVVNPAPNIDPNTGLPVAPAAENQAGSEQLDVGSYIIKIPSLTDVRLADVLDAIQLVCDHPIKYNIQDFAVVFSAKGPETPQLFMRTFRVDPNTFYSGLENVSAQSFGAVSSTGSGSSGGGGGGGGQNQNNGAVVGVVNAFSGAGGFRNTGSGGGGGGGGGGSQSGSGSLLNNTQGGGGAGGIGGTGGGGGGNQQNAGGLAYITTQTSMATPSALARIFFTTLGVNLVNPPGKSVFFNDRLGVLFVKATESDLDTIERALQVLNQVPPQVHIKARFIEVQQTDDNELGFDWYLGQFNLGNQVVGQGGSAASSTVPVSTANPYGVFPGNPAAGTTIAPSSTDQSLTQGLRSSAPTLATFTGIMTDPNFRVALRALSQRTGAETLGEPEITVLSGRQTQMRATSVITVVVGINFQQGQSATTTTGVGTGAVP